MPKKEITGSEKATRAMLRSLYKLELTLRPLNPDLLPADLQELWRRKTLLVAEGAPDAVPTLSDPALRERYRRAFGLSWPTV